MSIYHLPLFNNYKYVYIMLLNKLYPESKNIDKNLLCASLNNHKM